jgi:hypothetical protein
MTAQDQEGVDLATQMYKLDLAWMQNRVSTPGTSAELREISRNNENAKLVVRYQMIVHGAPTDKLYQYLNWPINAREPVLTMNGLSISKNGVVVCAGRTPEQCSGDKPDDPVDFVMAPAKGELYRLALVSPDEDVKVTAFVVPDPIVGKNKGCSVEVVRLMAKFELVMLKGSGFGPNEEVSFWSESYGETHEGKPKADSDGKFDVALLPFVKGKTGGEMKMLVKGTACSPSVSFRYGS